MQTAALSGEWMDFDHCLTYVEKGTADFVVEGRVYSLVPGDIIIIPPLCRHIIRSSEGEKLSQFILHFDFFSTRSSQSLAPLSIEEFLANCVLPKEEEILEGTAYVCRLTPKRMVNFQNDFLALLSEYQKSAKKAVTIDKALRMKALCIHMLAICFEEENLRADNAYYSKTWAHIHATVEYIHRNYDNSALDNMEICDEVGISLKYLTQIFRKELGTTVRRYINFTRLDAAVKLARLKQYNLSQIADTVGFGSIYTFNKSCKALTGLSPGEFIRKELDNIQTEEIYVKL